MNTTAQEGRGPGALDDALPPGRDDAVTVLFHMHWASLVRLARLLVDDVETAEDVVKVIEAVAKFVPKSNIVATTNCGMAPMRRDIAEAKLMALGAGAKLARQRFG